MNYQKYSPGPRVDLPERKWPDRVLQKAPVWCSVDLWDRNLALGQAGPAEKMEIFRLLIRLGFREIEIGSPASSQEEREYLLYLTEHGLIPEGVSLQVLSTCALQDIEYTLEALKGCHDAVIRLYSCDTEEETPEEVFAAASLVRSRAASFDGRLRLEYTINGFAGADPARALALAGAALEGWKPSPEDSLILGLPGGTELHMPNVYADQVEWMKEQLGEEDKVVLSVRPHNDRGMAAAAAVLSRDDVIVVSSVSCIYGIGSPEDYGEFAFAINVGDNYDRNEILRRLIFMQYERNDVAFERGQFRVRGDVIEINPVTGTPPIRIELFGDEIDAISLLHPVTGKKEESLNRYMIFPAKHFVVGSDRMEQALADINEELESRLQELNLAGKYLEAQRLEQRTRFDIEMLQE
ncbi:MAG: hypothetical protein II628_09040, partial [Lachnospiraceae bacterium]|nr:hypothetical protein [Lachnospiraceae bacterium]